MSKTATEFKVSLHEIDVPMPELWLEVYVVDFGDPTERRNFARMFARAKCKKAKSLETADLVVFVGGEDVNPSLYGQTPHPSVYWNDDRDAAEIEIYKKCLELGIPMFGVCRGAQFLWVMNGGTLFQDIDNHNRQHGGWDTRKRTFIKRVSSVHHQSCRRTVFTSEAITLLDTAAITTDKWINDKERDNSTTLDIEAYYFPSTCCLGVQGHPEYDGYFDFMQWTLSRIEEFVSWNKDLELVRVDGPAGPTQCLRLKEDIRRSRDVEFAAKLKELN